ncbi:hypothetical protein CC80DRAFT_537461 [Byssothecium circinans]|uniref:Uncharacterized protein n=1 Tax=Byssothecium circinans TaxID=147558 RepID=A0A6A5TMH3_9PLEO|nr:hypothetical protein CC80DRAFT_537461 [Byssothecium circinans]
MGIQDRIQKRKITERLQARQTTASPASPAASKTYPIPTAKVALTSTFTGSSTCAQNLLTMLPPPTYQIWANEPVPVENNTVAGCYPSEYLSSYTAVMVTVGTSPVPSSIVPAMSPFACPKDYCTAVASARNYIVCCPTGYQFHPPDSTVDSARPFYGGTCYSEMTMGSSYPVIQYNTNADTASTLFPVTATGVQAYAHPIDGFAMTSPTNIGCSNTKSSSGLTADSSKPASSGSQSSPAASSGAAAATTNPVSSGVIAGAVIGSVLGLAAIVGLVFFLLAYRRKHNQAAAPPSNVHHLDDDFATGKGADIYRHEANNNNFVAEIAPSSHHELSDEKGAAFWSHSRANDGHGAFEMSTEQPIEMYAGADGKTDYDDKSGLAVPPTAAQNNRSSIAKVLDKHDQERERRSANWREN